MVHLVNIPACPSGAIVGRYGEVDSAAPVNVKLPDEQIRRLDAAIASGRVSNRSEALRMGLDQLLSDWDRRAWEERWDCIVPDDDEFADLAESAVEGWKSLEVFS
jgi:Arc/MetJ-type ribon-helix-helix transcriptional regulator